MSFTGVRDVQALARLPDAKRIALSRFLRGITVQARQCAKHVGNSY